MEIICLRRGKALGLKFTMISLQISTLLILSYKRSERSLKRIRLLNTGSQDTPVLQQFIINRVVRLRRITIKFISDKRIKLPLHNISQQDKTLIIPPHLIGKFIR